MPPSRTLRAVGLMSGTSMDGVDATVLETDGETIGARGPFLILPYDPGFRERLRGVLGRDSGEELANVARELTRHHGEAVRRLLAMAGLMPGDIDVVGFHGHTVLHDPGNGRTLQIGDGDLLARETGIPVVADFRSQDVSEGGQGAPLASLYHRAQLGGGERPIAVLNLGGVANVTWIGPGEEILAFDTGPANAMIDDWMIAHIGHAYDHGGALAARGSIDESLLGELLQHPYFDRKPPKSLDRDDFRAVWRRASAGRALSAADGAATLTAFTARSVARALERLPVPPKRWLATGGGRHNATMMTMLSAALGMTVEPVEAAGADGDALEAEAFAFLAVRSLKGLPLSVPGTTGVPAPCRGGRLFALPKVA